MDCQNQKVSSEAKQSGEGTTLLKTIFNGINALSGVGILTIPYALAQGGWLSLSLLFVVAILCCYTSLLLQRCMEAHPRVNSYPDIGGLAFGSKGRSIVSFFIYFELYLVAVEFLILEGDNLHKLFPRATLKIASLSIHGKQLFVLLTALLVLPSTWLQSLGTLAYVSACGVVSFVVLVASVFWVGEVGGMGFHEKGEFVNWIGIPTSISLFTFSYCGHPVLSTLRNSMKDKSQFPKVLIVCFAAITFCYGFMGIQGYLMFGKYVPALIITNLPLSNVGSKVAIFTILVLPLAKYPIMIVSIAANFEDKFSLNERRLVTCLVRTALVISSVAVALTVPFFGYIMAFIGAFLSVSTTMLFPCLCYLKINKASKRLELNLELVVIGAILVIGTLVAVFGTYTSLSNIIDRLAHNVT